MTPVRAWVLVTLFALGCESPEERPTSWSYLHASIVEPSCATASCHSKVSSEKGIDLSTRTTAYAMLTGRTCDAPDDLTGEPEGWYVWPFDPDRSQLMHLLRGENVAVMPPDQPLPDVEVELIERWILAGAACD